MKTKHPTLTPAQLKARRAHQRRFLFSVTKECEGGIGQKTAMEWLRDAGIDCAKGFSIYVGQTGIIVFGGDRVVRRAERILYGN